MIQTKSITFSYNGTTVFQFPDISCQEGETCLITGGSGKGKTTLLHILGGLLRAASGEVVVNKTNIELLSERKLDYFRGRNIGLVLQENHFIEAFTVLENVMLASWLASGKKGKDKATSLLEHLDLKEQLHKLPSQLSVGQQQRASIARALINEPKVVLADEPTSSLDDENAFKVADLLEKLAQEYKTALVIVTHDSRLKERFTHQISLS